MTGDQTDPAAARRRRLPPGGIPEALAMADGAVLRTRRWPGQGRGSLLLMTGRGDFFEKYAESLHDLLEAGWAVSVFDWRGQGGSGRLGRTPMHGHAEDFSLWRRDLAEVMAWFRAANAPPFHALAHSMGGHLLLHQLAEDPACLSRAVLLAPMLGLSAPRYAAAAARAMVAMGRGGNYVLGGGPYGTAGDVRQPLLTSDPARYADERWWIERQPDLALGSATWGWLAAAYASLKALDVARITTPLLVLMGEKEQLVANDATIRLLDRKPNIRLEVIPGAAHELLRERSDIRARVLARINDYLDQP
ncbi:alpha/beta hydrolase [Polymorphobacter sp.]|uniref:alpha/beta hydrolase n=1 Tax=Polymorphobacter sp. TaxID=1909290 RepID=UPI003F7010BB